ncbi:MAG TPA: tripartite tricarboxylate transporter substrate binding protein [Burkholderiales bacterium]|nr:tripartite tricarboxylate transporter substrate binding protein [Burkholderiales bacterium]
MRNAFAGKLCASLAVACAGALPLCASPAEYPSKQIRVLIPFQPGGSTDILARVVASHLGQAWGQQVVADNRPGANGIIAAEILTKSPPDGHTLLFVAMGHAINSLIYKKLPYDTERDFTPVSLAALYSQLVIVHPSVPARTLKELIALAKARRMTYASGGIGSSQHLAGALFSHMAKIEMSHVPYKGGAPGLLDVMAGNVELMITQPTSSEYIKSGRLRALAISSPKRSPYWPELPTVSEAGLPGYQSEAWYGLVAPRNLPADVLKKLNEETVRALRAPALKESLAIQGGTPVGSTPAEFSSFIKAEINRYAKVVRDAGISAD